MCMLRGPVGRLGHGLKPVILYKKKKKSKIERIGTGVPTFKSLV